MPCFLSVLTSRTTERGKVKVATIVARANIWASSGAMVAYLDANLAAIRAVLPHCARPNLHCGVQMVFVGVCVLLAAFQTGHCQCRDAGIYIELLGLKLPATLDWEVVGIEEVAVENEQRNVKGSVLLWHIALTSSMKLWVLLF
jgi:hypothetical protein